MRYVVFLLLAAINSFAFPAAQSSTRQLKKVLELKIPREGGANAASVAWHPGQRKYYAAMAGNVDFCMAVFDANGKRLSPPEQKTMFDVRGLWYNPHTKTLQVNGYNDFGWGEYSLDGKGLPLSVKKLHAQMNQPDEQSVGAFNANDKVVYFFNSEGNLDIYEYDNAQYSDYIELSLGQSEDGTDDSKDNYEVLEEYNSTTVIYTGTPKGEIGLLNVGKNRVELYDLQSGYLTKKLGLPKDAPVNNFLDFAYCNGIYWLFDKGARTWKGYK